MSQLGPVIGNRSADNHRATPKPPLRERLALESCRSTPLGTVVTGADGRLSFTPQDHPMRGWDTVQGDMPTLPRPDFCPGQCVRVDATVAELLVQESCHLDAGEAQAAAGLEGVVMGYLECDALVLVVVQLGHGPWAFVPRYLASVPAAEGDDEREAVARGPAFDPYTDPLALSDTVQGMDGRIGRVTLIEPQRLGVVFERGSAWCGDLSARGSFRLLATAPAWGYPDSWPF
jgi:hypothetical protein